MERSGQATARRFVILASIFISIQPVFTGYSWADPRKSWLQKHESIIPMPEFDLTQSPVVTVLAGQTALLPCTVRDLGDRVVSWIRTRDLHILTSNVHQYTSDTRFEAVHPLDSDSWMLRVNGSRLSDTGLYECQVNTDPKIKFPVSLTVLDADQLHDSPTAGGSGELEHQARIAGPQEQVVRHGATVTFTCEVSPVTGGVATRPAHTLHLQHNPLTWSFAGRPVSFQAPRGGISVHTDNRDTTATSHLTVAMVTDADAGDYTCSRNDAHPATVTLLVLHRERSEAMQRDMAYNLAHCSFPNLRWTFVLCACSLLQQFFIT